MYSNALKAGAAFVCKSSAAPAFKTLVVNVTGVVESGNMQVVCSLKKEIQRGFLFFVRWMLIEQQYYLGFTPKSNTSST